MAEQATSPISCSEQVCYERILPQESHFYKPHKTPSDTGKHREMSRACRRGAVGNNNRACDNYVCIRLATPRIVLTKECTT